MFISQKFQWSPSATPQILEIAIGIGKEFDKSQSALMVGDLQIEWQCESAFCEETGQLCDTV